jgi:hypothetical protein
LTVDAGSNPSKSDLNRGNAVKFTKEELADCFTLKENSASDTKEKVGITWPEYDPSSLGVLGCEDVSLLTVAKFIPDVLSFVHIVSDPEEIASSSSMVVLSDRTNDDDDLPDYEADDTAPIGYASDSDEYEFDL